MADTLFPLYELLVESIFGSVGLAIVGIAVVLAIILLICRTSGLFLAYWMMFYFMVMGTLYLGAVGLVISFLLAFAMIVYNVYKTWFREG